MIVYSKEIFKHKIYIFYNRQMFREFNSPSWYYGLVEYQHKNEKLIKSESKLF